MAHRVAGGREDRASASATSTSRSRARRISRATRPRAVAGLRLEEAQPRGFLFPATYDFLASTTSAQLVQEQLDAFRANWAKVDLAYARKKNLTPYDVLIIASMVESETLAPDERPLVARRDLQPAARAA